VIGFMTGKRNLHKHLGFVCSTDYHIIFYRKTIQIVAKAMRTDEAVNDCGEV
jgi:hypothetical protein